MTNKLKHSPFLFQTKVDFPEMESLQRDKAALGHEDPIK